MTCPTPSCGGCARLAKLDATEPTSQNFLDLIHKRHFIKCNMNHWHYRLAARLPVELVSRIFIFFDNVNEPGEEESRYMTQNKVEHWDHLLRTPALLSRVCRRWRSIVLTTPQLWTNYSFDVWIQAPDLELLQRFLSRSGSLPLSLMLWGDPGNYNDEKFKNISMEPLANLIRSYSARWKFLDLSYLPEGLAHQILHNIDYIPPSVLEGLKVDYEYLPESIPLREPLRPTHLSIIDMDDIAKIPLQWHNLTYLELSRIRMSMLLHIVIQAPQLETWISDGVDTFHDVSLGPQYPLPDTPIVLPTLKRLEICFIENNVDDFFPLLTFSSLTHLKCHFGIWAQIRGQNLNLDELFDFLSRSKLDSKSLQTFDLQYNLFGTDYDRAFVNLTALTHLSVHVLTNTNIVTDPYLSEISDISILPHLRRFEVTVPRMPATSWPLLCNILRGDMLPFGDEPVDSSDYTVTTTQNPSQPRWQHRRPLKEFIVTVYTTTIPSIIPEIDYVFLASIKNKGVKVNIQDHFSARHWKGPSNQDILQQMSKLYDWDLF